MITTEDLVAASWEEFVDSYGNHGYVTHAQEPPCAVLLYDDDAFHCQAGEGFSWRLYEDGYDGSLEDLAYDLSADAVGAGFCSFDEAIEDMIETMFDGNEQQVLDGTIHLG